jgi:hypothetical protein
MTSRRTTVVWVLGLVATIGAFLSSRFIWPPHPMVPHPTEGQIPFLVGLSVAEAVALGVGVVFLLSGWRFAERPTALSPWLRWASYLSVGWLLVSWWPHDNLHIHYALDMWPLIAIEYVFHVSLMVCGAILAYAFYCLSTARG